MDYLYRASVEIPMNMTEYPYIVDWVQAAICSSCCSQARLVHWKAGVDLENHSFIQKIIITNNITKIRKINKTIDISVVDVYIY